MRTLVLFALTLGSVATLAADASAFGKRKKAAATPVVYSSYSPCDCGGHGYPGGYYPHGYYPGSYPHGAYYPGYPGAYHPGPPALMPGVPIPGTGVVVPVPMPKK